MAKPKEHVRRITEAQERLLQSARSAMTAAGESSLYRASHGELPHFTAGDFVLAARVPNLGRHHKPVGLLVVRWYVVKDGRG